MLNTAQLTPAKYRKAATGASGTTKNEISRLRKKLVKASKKACPSWFSDQAEDIAQEVFIKLSDNRKRNPEKQRSLSWTYLNRVAFCTAMDEIRKSLRHPTPLSIDQDEEEEVFGFQPVSTRNPEQEYMSSEFFCAVRECFENLTQTERTAVNLHLMGHSLQEISFQQGWSKAQATNFVYRGLTSLRCRMMQKGIRSSMVA